MAIHPTAAVDPAAVIGQNVEIGPYAVVEKNCVIGDNCWIDAHAKVCEYTTVGAGSRIYYGALVGTEPQDHRFKPGIVSYTLIGKNAVIREYVTIHRSPFEGKTTVIGDGTLLMAFVHIGHDAQIGNYVTIANQTAVSGHVIIEDGAVLSGYVLIHQFCRIGKLAMIGGRTILTQDVPPYCMLAENCRVCGPNVVGMRRAGLDSDARLAIRKAIKSYFFKDLNGSNALAEIEKDTLTPEVEHFVEFIRSSERGIMAGESELAGFLFDEEL
ncbi:MAG: acyl-ACP--UDP-N-acetylglucosamine O-acyltransferase [Lentisphaerae bacterium]|nr:acyl-ACP--UDP-N-acetylglucosamine O-acyltransferase [Lentisphaerota bacterium]